jgi:hypothetical protein
MSPKRGAATKVTPPEEGGPVGSIVVEAADDVLRRGRFEVRRMASVEITTTRGKGARKREEKRKVMVTNDSVNALPLDVVAPLVEKGYVIDREAPAE